MPGRTPPPRTGLLRWALRLAFAALVALPGAASALTLEEIVSRVWTRFEAECSLAFSDPQQFLRMIEADYPSHIVQTSPDGGFYILWAEQQVGPSERFTSSYATQGTNGLGSADCHVSFGSYTAGGESWRPEAMDAAFRAEALRRGATSLAGGVMKNHDVTADQMLDGAPDFDTYDYVMTGPIGPGYLTEVAVTGVDFTLTVIVVGRTGHPLAPPRPVAAPVQATPSAPATGDLSFDAAVRTNLDLALRLCIEADGSIPAAVSSFGKAGFSYQPMAEQNGDVWHRFFAPGGTLRAETLQGQTAPSCDLYTDHLPPRDVAPLVADFLEQIVPGRFRPAPAEGACAMFTDGARPMPTLISVGAVDGTAGCAALGSSIVSVFKGV